MGVPVGKADGDSLILCECEECGDRYEIDETMDNSCPYCHSPFFEFIDAESNGDWR